MSRLFVGNIPFSQSEDDIRDWFEVHGFRVLRTEIIRDKATGQSRGFGFVEVHEGSAAKEVITALNQKELAGRRLTVNLAVPVGSNRKSAA